MAGAAVMTFVIVTREPADPLAVGTVIAAAAAISAGGMGLLALALEERWSAQVRSRGRDPRRRRALRRGLGFGALVAVLALLRAVDGLTIVTGGFVIAGFALAELVLVARPAANSG